MLSPVNRFPLLPASVTSSPLDDLCSFFPPLSSIVVLRTSPGSYLVTVWTGWETIHSGRQQQATAHNQPALTPPPPPPPPHLSGQWFVSQLLLLLLLRLGGVFIFFFFSGDVSWLLPPPPPALKKTLPALLLSSLLPALPHISSSEPFCLKHLAPTGSSTYRRFRRDLTLLFADRGMKRPKTLFSAGSRHVWAAWGPLHAHSPHFTAWLALYEA